MKLTRELLLMFHCLDKNDFLYKVLVDIISYQQENMIKKDSHVHMMRMSSGNLDMIMGLLYN